MTRNFSVAMQFGSEKPVSQNVSQNADKYGPFDAAPDAQEVSARVNLAKHLLHRFLSAPGTDTNDTKMETTAETVETIAEVLDPLEDRINTSYNH